jgi:hypothetical protein
MRDFYTITKADIGRFSIRFHGQSWPVVNFIGRIMPQDVGKRVYEIRGILQVESQDQLNNRLKQEARP